MAEVVCGRHAELLEAERARSASSREDEDTESDMEPSPEPMPSSACLPPLMDLDVLRDVGTCMGMPPCYESTPTTGQGTNASSSVTSPGEIQ